MSTVEAPTTPATESEADETTRTPAEQVAAIDAALADLEERRVAITKRSANIPGVIADELTELGAEENQARQALVPLEADLATFPARVGAARASVTMAQGSAATSAAEEVLEHLLETQRRAEEQLAQARGRCETTLAACAQKRATLEKERADLEAGLAEIGAARTALEQQKRALHATEGMQVIGGIRDEVEQLRGAVAEKQAALDAAQAALRARQERVPSELGAYRGVPQVVAATAELPTDDAHKSSPQVFIDAVGHLLDTLERLRSSDIATISVTWEVNSVLTQLANPA